MTDLVALFEELYGRPGWRSESDPVDGPDVDDWSDPGEADHAADVYHDR
jgi:hypothetical protein